MENKIILFIGWFLGNLIIFSGIVYLKYSISGVSFDTFLVGIIMAVWVFVQIVSIDYKFNKKEYGK